MTISQELANAVEVAMASSAAAVEMKDLLNAVDSLSGESAYLDGVTAGTAAASKAMVTDSSNRLGSLANLAIGAAIPTNPQARFAILPGAVTATANQSYYHQTIVPSAALTIPAGTAAVVASLNVAEPNITATGTVTVAATVRIADAPTEGSSNYALWVDAGVTRLDGNLTFADAAADIIGKANTAAALEVTDGTTSLYTVDTRNTVTVQNHVFAQPASQTLPDGATSRFRLATISAPTVTLAGQTQITTTNQGASLFIGGPTYNQSGGAVTVDQVSTLHVGAVTAGASVTITAPYMISTGVADCFLTNAGVWTDTSCWAYGKDGLMDAAGDAIDSVLAKIMPKTWTYKSDVHGNDEGRQRVGIAYDDLPDELRAPGQKRGVSPGLLAAFALAACKRLMDRVDELEAKLATR